jgi:hypothetical protein
MTSMKTERRWAYALLVALGIGIAASIAGCAKDERKEAIPTSASDSAERAHGEAGIGTSVAPGATVGDIRRQIEERQLALETSINEGRLSEVHDAAFAIRDLAVAAGERAGTGHGDPAARGRAIEDLRAIAGRLDEYGDAGNLSGTEAEFKKLNAALADLWAATPD